MLKNYKETKNLSPRFNTLPLAWHANTSFRTFAVPKKNLIHAFSGHWPLFLLFLSTFWPFFALPCRLACASGTRRQNCARCTKKYGFRPAGTDLYFIQKNEITLLSCFSTYLICQINCERDIFYEIFYKKNSSHFRNDCQLS